MTYIVAIIVILFVLALYFVWKPAPKEEPPPAEDYNLPPIRPKPAPPASQIFTDEKHKVERGTKSIPEGWIDDREPGYHNWSAKGIWYETEIVGESHYQANIERHCAPAATNIELTADLVLEDDNPHDKNAVRVDIGGRTVGYLSRQDAKIYRKLLDAGNVEKSYAALVRGAPGRRGVYLSLDMRNYD